MNTLHHRSKAVRFIIIVVPLIALVWTALTIWVERPADDNVVVFGGPGDSLKVLIVYDPDPIYNLDEQVCRALAKGLNEKKAQVTLATARAASNLEIKSYKSVVVCANTYNWAPDQAVIDFVTTADLAEKNVVAITVGSGSTSAAREKLEKKLHAVGAKIILSKEWWLMRPNDESRLEEENVDVAVDQAYRSGVALADFISN